MSRMLPLEPIMVEGALCSKEKEKCGETSDSLFSKLRLNLHLSHPFTLPSTHIDSRAFRHARTHDTSEVSPYTLLHVGPYK